MTRRLRDLSEERHLSGRVNKMQVCEGMRPSTPQAEEIASAKVLRWDSAYFVEGRGCLVLEKMARRLDGHSEGFGVILRVMGKQ